MKIGRESHDPLCALRTTECLGCLLVNLRSDATYEYGKKRTDALEELIRLRDVVQAHLDDVYAVERG